MAVKGCKDCGTSEKIYVPISPSGGSGTPTIVTGTSPVIVTESVQPNVITYNVSHPEILPLTATFNTTSIINTPSEKSGIVPLKGTVVTDVSLGWSFLSGGTPTDVDQTVNNVAITPNTVKATTVSSLNIQYADNIAAKTFTLVGTDTYDQSIIKTSVIAFGHKIFFGEYLYSGTEDDPTIKSLVEGLDNNISVIKSVNYTAISLDPAIRVWVAIPAELGTTAFKDNSSPINVDPMFLYKSNFEINNGAISDELYNIYVSKQGSLRNSNIVNI